MKPSFISIVVAMQLTTQNTHCRMGNRYVQLQENMNGINGLHGGSTKRETMWETPPPDLTQGSRSSLEEHEPGIVDDVIKIQNGASKERYEV